MSVTPASVLVVAPAGYSLTACTMPASRARRDLVRRRVVGQVQRHQRLERACPAGSAARMRSAVVQRQRGGGHRRLQVGHDDGARELARGVRQHRAHRVAVAQVQVPVVGAGQRQRRSSCRIVAALLQPPHLGIAPVARQQLGMRAALDHAALLQHHDLVRVDHRGQPVRDDQRGLALRRAAAARPGWRARWPSPAPRWPRRRSGSAGSSAACARSPRAASRRPTASGRARRPWCRSPWAWRR